MQPINWKTSKKSKKWGHHHLWTQQMPMLSDSCVSNFQNQHPTDPPINLPRCCFTRSIFLLDHQTHWQHGSHWRIDPGSHRPICLRSHGISWNDMGIPRADTLNGNGPIFGGLLNQGNLGRQATENWQAVQPCEGSHKVTFATASAANEPQAVLNWDQEREGKFVLIPRYSF